MNTRQLLGQVAGRDVYVSELGLASPLPWIYSRAAVEGLESLALGDDELLTVTVGGLDAVMRPEDGDSFLARFDRLVSFARILPAEAETKAPLNAQKLPAELRELLPLVVIWGLSDDQERSDLIERADDAALRGLVERGRTRLTRIDEFLREPGMPKDSPEIGRFDSFAQAVMEAEQELRRRAKS
ncbi:MAG TPA: hypothetical protein VJT33_13405 [bacterium]|nr:hypothetical protein [bacterium]